MFSKLILLFALAMLMISCTEQLEYEFVPYHQTIQETPALERINFFLETSVSMKGYVNSDIVGHYPLKEVIPFLITDLDKMYNDIIQIYTITNSPRKYRQDRQRFEDQLNKGTILEGRSSKLQNVFGHVIDAVKENSVSILVSDCIPDLGKSNTRVHSSKITTKIYHHLIQKEDLGVVVFQYLSDFNGTYYYDRLNTGSGNPRERPYYNIVLQNRPFYIWVFGNKHIVKELVSRDIFGKYAQSHSYNIPMNNAAFHLLKNPREGKIAINIENNLLRIKEISQNRPVQFTMGINLHKQLRGFHKQFMDSNNYTVEPGFLKETIVLKTKNRSILSEKNVDKPTIEHEKLSHFLQPIFHDLNPNTEKIKITLFNKNPLWIKQTSLDDDLGIVADSLTYKTFAFNTITKAFDRAFKSQNDTLAHFTLTKKRQ